MNDATQWGARHRAKREEKKAKKRSRRSPGTRAHAAVAPEPTSRLGALDLSDDLVTVSVATWNTPVRLLERAVASVLNGTHRHIRVVVISDGEKEPSWKGLSDELKGDPRLVCIASPRNFGPYFNHDVVLRAASGPWFAIQDSDDYSHPTRFHQLHKSIHAHRAEAVHTNVLQIETNKKRHVLRGSAQAGEAWSHRANHFGLYSVSALLKLGGYHAGFRVGYDTNLTGFLNLLAVTKMAPKTLYTREKRPQSLTRHRKTGHGSALRKAHKAALRRMWDQAVTKRKTSRTAAANAIRQVAMNRVRQHGDLKLRDQLVGEVKERLGAISIDPPPVHEALLRRLVHGLAGASPWEISVALAKALYRRCEAERPSVVLDVGSGLSTAVFALYASRYGARVVSLEHDPKWRDAIRARLARVKLLSHVEIVCKPLRRMAGGVWYGVDLKNVLGDDRVQMAFVDGPPRDLGGRALVVPSIAPHLAPGAAILAHDACRTEERAQIRRWCAEYELEAPVIETKQDERGVALLRWQADA